MINNSFIRYLIVGGVGFVCEMVALYVLHVVLRYDSLVSVAISFWVGFVVAFILQKLVTFRNYDRSKRAVAKQLIFYSALVTWNYVFTLAAITLFSELLSVFILRTIIILIVTAWNFIIYKTIFKTPSEQPR